MAKIKRLIMCIDSGGSSTKAISDTASKTNAGLELSTTTRTTLVMDSDIIKVPRGLAVDKDFSGNDLRVFQLGLLY